MLPEWKQALIVKLQSIYNLLNKMQNPDWPVKMLLSDSLEVYTCEIIYAFEEKDAKQSMQDYGNTLKQLMQNFRDGSLSVDKDEALKELDNILSS